MSRENSAKCICQLCSCGRHRCPHASPNPFKMGYEPCKLSEYGENYIPYPVHQRPRHIRPPHRLHSSSEPFSSETTHTQDFTSWPVAPAPSFRPPRREYRRPEIRFDHQSVSHTDYTPKPFQPVKSFRPKPTEFNLFNDGFLAPLESNSLTDLNIRKPISDRITSRPRSSRHLAMDFATDQALIECTNADQVDHIRTVRSYSALEDNQAQYQDEEPQQLGSRPKSTEWRKEGPFDAGGTVYQQDYVEKPQKPCPAGQLLSGNLREYKLINVDEHGHRWYRITGLHPGSDSEESKNKAVSAIEAI